MRVALNLVGLPSLRQGGAGLYAGMLGRGLVTHASVRPVVLCGPEVAGELADLGTDVELHPVPVAPAQRAHKLAQLALSLHDPRRYADGYARPAASTLDGCEVVHYPLSFMGAPQHSLPSVITCLDLQHIAHPGFFSAEDRALRRIRWHRALRVADRVIAISGYTRDSLVDRLGVDPDRIDVVHLACNDRFFEPVPSGRRQIPGEFVFYPASPLPAKNHRRLLRAFARVAPRNPGLSLVLSGPVLHDWTPVRRACHEQGLERRVVFAGHLSLTDLHAHYARARALVFPSLFEGFGLPVLEAMASGCPVAAADAASVPEVAGDCAILFDPRDEDAIAEAIERSIAMPEADREAMIARARERATQFRVREMVRRTVAAHRRAVVG